MRWEVQPILLGLLALAFFLLVEAHSETINVQEAWNGKKWVTVAFVKNGNENSIREYVTGKDVTDKVNFIVAGGEMIMILKDKR